MTLLQNLIAAPVVSLPNSKGCLTLELDVCDEQLLRADGGQSRGSEELGVVVLLNAGQNKNVTRHILSGCITLRHPFLESTS